MRTPVDASTGNPQANPARDDACGVYVHVPFCRRRCPYCDFAFEVRPADARFAPAVAWEMHVRRGELPGPPSTLSLGGGTPSALGIADLALIVGGARTIALHDDAEVALELNPEDVDDAFARELVRIGFTRASLGIQSFDDDVLAYLGRAHDGARARSAVRACVSAGLHTGVDLIVGVPGETAQRLARDIDVIAALGAGHVSAYLLTLEEGTPLVQLISRGARARVDDDMQACAYEDVQRLLTAVGYRQYEVSSYARPGEESVHNRLYWGGGMYLGVGPSAHSMRRTEDGRVIRRHTTARFDAWIDAPAGAVAVEDLEPAHALREAVAFGVRDLGAGVDVVTLARRHGIDPLSRDVAAIEKALAAAGDDVTRVGSRVYLTAKGARFADRVSRAVLATG